MCTKKTVSIKIFSIIFFLFFFQQGNCQFLMDMVDTTTDMGKGILSIYRKFDHLRFSGYIQPQYQVAQDEGTKTFEGGNFGERVSNRFMLRRSRVRIDYVHFGENTRPGVQFVFQFDANERAFTVRDVWGRIFENRLKLFSFTTGMFARPFGFEVNYSSSDRESPERGRMSQLLMKSERDLGAMISFDARKEHTLKFLKIDVGLFNGQGINAAGEFDNKKDLIGRMALKPKLIGKKLVISGGMSVLYGGLENSTKYHYTTIKESGLSLVKVDSSDRNIGKTSPRHYYGADLQLKILHRKTNTEIRGEIITGKQTGTLSNTETPVELLTGSNGFHERQFAGGYIYLLQHLFNKRNQILLKYDWYDPNTNTAGREIGQAGSGFTAADIRYNTIGAGYLNYLTDNIKLVLYYAMVHNERTSLIGYANDIKDNVFTCRLQFRF